MHPAVWENVVDALFWLQLAWIICGFILMGYFALKVFPFDKERKNSRSDSSTASAKRPELITLGNYRFEMVAETTRPHANVVELYPKQPDRNVSFGN